MGQPRKLLAFGERGRFLRALEETGEVKAAARIAGVAPYRLYRLRGHDPAFSAAWAAALAHGKAARVVAERGRGLTQVKRVTRRQWRAEDAARAVSVAAETGSLKSVAARTGFCADTIRKARRGSPGFDAAIRAALAQATDRLEAELLDKASAAMGVPAAPCGGEPVRFAEALELVKHRRAVEAREARGAARVLGRARPLAPSPAIEDVRDRVKAKLAALRRARGQP